MDCDEIQTFVDIATKLGIPSLVIVGFFIKGKELMEGVASIISAFTGRKRETY